MSKKVSRRKFLKSAAYAGGSLALFSTGLFGSSTMASEGDLAATVVVDSPTTIIPGRLTDAPGQNIADAMYERLFMLEGHGDEGERTPWLVEDYDRTTDGKKYTFRLKKGVKFHHGTEMTASDVVFTFNRIMDPDFGSPQASLFSAVNDVTKKDKYTVVFELDRPVSDFQLKFFAYNTVILAKDFDYSEQEHSGTGPFKLVDYKSGESLRFEKFDDYWMDGVPHVDELTIRIVPEMSTRMVMIESGDADIAPFIGLEQYERLTNSSNAKAVATESAFHTPISMRADKPPFDDPRVRKAMKYVVDREQMFASAMGGVGSLGHDHPIWEGYPWYEDMGTRERNVEKAKELLAEAGYEDGISVDLHYGTNFPVVPATVLNYQQMAKPAGIEVNLVGSSGDVYYSKYWLKANMTCTEWIHRENPVDLLNVAFKGDGPWNESHYKNPELDEHIEGAATELDEEKRQKHFTEIQRILREDGGTIIPFFGADFSGLSQRVNDFWMTRAAAAEYRHFTVD